MSSPSKAGAAFFGSVVVGVLAGTLFGDRAGVGVAGAGLVCAGWAGMEESKDDDVGQVMCIGMSGIGVLMLMAAMTNVYVG